MTEHNYTPGPWQVESGSTYIGGTGYIDEDACSGKWSITGGPNELILAVLIDDVNPLIEESEANALLIAAAPDMIEALQLYTERGHHDTCIAVLTTRYECNCGYDKAIAAISKAIGEEQ